MEIVDARTLRGRYRAAESLLFISMLYKLGWSLKLG